MFPILLLFFSILPIRPGKIVITSDFGEARPLRYHMGVDFSTHGKCGYPVYSVTDGEIVRVKRSYYGYGNAVYIMSEDSNIYVYAHLDRFIEPLEDTVFKAQVAEKKYRQDIYFKDGSFRVHRGDVIGYSGESGVGYPHLHFERRVGWLMPIFPLTDTISLSPVLDAIYIETPEGNYRVERIKNRNIVFPYFNRFKMFLSIRHAKKVIVEGEDSIYFVFSVDTLNYLTQRESGILYKPRHNGFRGYIRTNYSGKVPRTVKKYLTEYKDVRSLIIKLVSFYGDTERYFIKFDKNKKLVPVFDTTFDGVKYSFSDYGIRLSPRARKLGYRFVKYDGDTLIRIGDSNIALELNTTYFPYLRGLFYRERGDTLFVYPELPQLTGYIYVRTHDTGREIYRIEHTGRKKFTRKTLKLGVFLAIHDSVPPYIKYVGGSDSIAFYVDDLLSGVDADSFRLTVNNRWYPVYYVYERKIAVLRHHLKKHRSYEVSFLAMDRAGNRRVWKNKVYLR